MPLIKIRPRLRGGLQRDARHRRHAERPLPGTARGASAKPPGHRARKFNGGQGASWKTGWDAYGFQGAYGGCQYRGHAGVRGYRLDKVC